MYFGLPLVTKWLGSFVSNKVPRLERLRIGSILDSRSPRLKSYRLAGLFQVDLFCCIGWVRALPSRDEFPTELYPVVEVVMIEGAWVVPALKDGLSETCLAYVTFIKFKASSALFLHRKETFENGTVIRSP